VSPSTGRTSPNGGQKTRAELTAYLELARAREAIDAELADETLPASRREELQQLRGAGAPGDADITYGSIYESDTETIVSLQGKLQYVLNVLQSADARPTTQAMDAVQRLEAAAAELLATASSHTGRLARGILDRGPVEFRHERTGDFQWRHPSGGSP